MSQALVNATVLPGRSVLENVPNSERFTQIPGSGRTAAGATTERRLISVDHRRYSPGETLQLPAAEAERLAQLGFVRID
ncbi:hypothetical protein ACMS1Z_00290 [Acidiphilium multivorum]|uniref:hypothetical protein n=1 Tax=Acidiphilium multivorum TaxID=62140 RepID=UPI0039C94068